MGEIGMPTLDEGAAMGVMAFQVWLLSIWRKTDSSFLEIKCVQLLCVSEGFLVLGGGSWDVLTVSLRARLPHILGCLWLVCLLGKSWGQSVLSEREEILSYVPICLHTRRHTFRHLPVSQTHWVWLHVCAFMYIDMCLWNQLALV